MLYAQQSDISPARLSARTLAQVTSDVNPPVLDPTVVTAKLTEASGVVEMFCRQRYKLPLQPTAELVGMTCSIAIYLLYSRKDGAVPEHVRDNYQDALRFLRDIAAEKASLDQPIGASDQSPSGGVVRSNRKPRFSNRNIEGYE